MISNKKSYFAVQWRTVHFTLRPAMTSYLNDTLC